jgi:hypothetical protein
MEELPQQWRESYSYLFIKREIRLTVVITEEHQCYQLHTKCLQGYLHTLTNLVEIISEDFDVIYQLLIGNSAFVRYWRKIGSVMGHHICNLQKRVNPKVSGLRL